MDKRSVVNPASSKSSGSIPAEKLRGGYYTPELVSEWLCAWAIQTSRDRVLEPGCGDGVFLAAAASRLLQLGARKQDVARQLAGVEIAPTESKKARSRTQSVSGRTDVHTVTTDDFFRWIERRRPVDFDCVVGNPPFIRYQNFPEPSRSRAMSLMESEGLRRNKLTNIWVPFVVGATSCLRKGGRLAMVLPAEMLQVTYAAQLRSYLADRFATIEIFACNHMIFDRAEQEVVLFLADGRLGQTSESNACRIALSETPNLDKLLAAVPGDGIKKKQKKVVHDGEKWLKYFLSPREITFMRSLRQSTVVVPLRHHASIDVGVVTGKNEFFVVSQEEVDEFDLKDYVVPLVGRSAQLPGSVLRTVDWKKMAKAGQKVFLLALLPNGNGSLNKGVKRYIQSGERKGLHTGYKCRIRDPWYRVPSVWTPECFFFRQIYDFPRVVLNQAGATSTDTIHRMRCNGSTRRLVENAL